MMINSIAVRKLHWTPDFGNAEPDSMRHVVEYVWGDVVYLTFRLKTGELVEIPFHAKIVNANNEECEDGEFIWLHETTYKHWKCETGAFYTNGEAISVIQALNGNKHRADVLIERERGKDEDGDCIWEVWFKVSDFKTVVIK